MESVSNNLEMKTMKPVRRNIRRQIFYVALVTAFLLIIPLIGMQFSDEVDWSVSDFIFMGILIFSTGLAYVLISRTMDSAPYRAAVGIAVVAGFLLIWINLAVGIIGSEDNPANALYVAVLFIGLIGGAIAQFRPSGMARALLATAIAQALVPVIALIAWRPSLDDPPGMVGVFILNMFFVGLFIVSATLFQRASASESTQG